MHNKNTRFFFLFIVMSQYTKDDHDVLLEE